MKKNKLNLLLVVVVTAIWGFVVLKATGNLFANENEITQTEDTALPDMQTSQKLTNEKLQLNYSDPFLGTGYKPEMKISINNSSARIKNQKTKIENTLSKEMPPVKFFGLVRNTGTNKMVAIVSVNNSEKRMLAGETYNDIRLEKITQDSILVSWNKIKTYIKK